MDNSHPTAGPNQIIPSDKFTTTDIFSAVKIRTGDAEIAKAPFVSVPHVFEAAVNAAPNRVALAYKKNPEDTGFQYITFREYRVLVRTVGKAFLKLGLERLHSVAIIGFNSPEWFFSYLGCIHAGGVACGVYTTNSAEATYYCLEKGLTNIAVVEDDNQAQKILKYKDKLPKLKAIIQYSGTPTAQGVLSWEELLNIGRGEKDTALDAALQKIAVNECCTIIYTSGTTGNAKGVMLSHDNLIWDAYSVLSILGVAQDERLISYLPLSHVAALVVDVYCHILYQVTVYFANRDALKGGLINTLLEVRPTRFLGIPRIWEKISEKMKAVGAEAGFLKKQVAAWAKSQGLQRNLDLMKGIDSPSLSYLIAKSLIFSKIKNKLGLDHCKTFWSGAAPLATDIKLYLASLDIPIMEAFGMSESGGVHTINTINAFRFDSAGRTIPGAKTKIENPDHEKQGEICMYGRHVYMGYIDDLKQTNDSIDPNGWLHSGDIGKVDKEGFLYITGRIKELLITAGGENISPLLIEQNVKAELPFLGQAIVIGDKKKFLSMLVTLTNEVDGDTGEAKDELTPAVTKWLRDLGFAFTKTSEVIASGPDKKKLFCNFRIWSSTIRTWSNDILSTTNQTMGGNFSLDESKRQHKWTVSLGYFFIEKIISGPDKTQPCTHLYDNETKKTIKVNVYKHNGPMLWILDSIQKGIDAANEKAISNAQRVQKFAILPKDFSMVTGELGPTLKLKRSVINEKYKHVIDKFYET